MFEPKATRQELEQLKVEQSTDISKLYAFVNRELKMLAADFNNQIVSELTKVRVENRALLSELTALKSEKQSKAADNMPEIVSHEDYYRVTFRDENKGVKTQVEVTPDGINLIAENIVLNDLPDFKGKNISSAQI